MMPEKVKFVSRSMNREEAAQVLAARLKGEKKSDSVSSLFVVHSVLDTLESRLEEERFDNVRSLLRDLMKFYLILCQQACLGGLSGSYLSDILANSEERITLRRIGRLHAGYSRALVRRQSNESQDYIELGILDRLTTLNQDIAALDASSNSSCTSGYEEVSALVHRVVSEVETFFSIQAGLSEGCLEKTLSRLTELTTRVFRLLPNGVSGPKVESDWFGYCKEMIFGILEELKAYGLGRSLAQHLRLKYQRIAPLPALTSAEESIASSVPSEDISASWSRQHPLGRD